jgi:hypothetical protein
VILLRSARPDRGCAIVNNALKPMQYGGVARIGSGASESVQLSSDVNHIFREQVGAFEYLSDGQCGISVKCRGRRKTFAVS